MVKKKSPATIAQQCIFLVRNFGPVISNFAIPPSDLKAADLKTSENQILLKIKSLQSYKKENVSFKI